MDITDMVTASVDSWIKWLSAKYNIPVDKIATLENRRELINDQMAILTKLENEVVEANARRRDSS